jgi:hypothetical protein
MFGLGAKKLKWVASLPGIQVDLADVPDPALRPSPRATLSKRLATASSPACRSAELETQEGKTKETIYCERFIERDSFARKCP